MRSPRTSLARRMGGLSLAFLLAALTAAALVRPAFAHEGHAALPSTGVKLDGNQLLVSPPAIKAIGLETHKIVLGDLRHVLRVDARVELPVQNQAKVATLMSGKIDEVFVKPGQFVHAGDELARVSSLELESLQSELLESAEELDLLRRLVAQRELAVKGGVLAGKAVLDMRAQLQRKAAQHEVVRRKLEGLGLTAAQIDEVLRTKEPVRCLSVTAPIDGVVEHVDVYAGQLVESTDHLFEVVDASSAYIVGEVVETDAHEVAAGLPVETTFAGLAGRAFEGQIRRIRAEMDEVKRVLRVEVAVENAEGLLRPGMMGRMTIEVAKAKQEVLCPTGALIETETGVFVLLRESEGKFSRRAIKVGMRSPDRVVVQSGLFPGQQVVSKGTLLLASMYDGAAAPAKQPPSAASTAGAAPSSRNSSERRVTLGRVTARKAVVELPTNQRTLATSLMEGRVAELLVMPGEEVRAGQPVCVCECPTLRNLQLELLEAESKRKWASGEVQRLRPSATSGILPQKDFWELETELQTLEQRVAGLMRKLKLVGLSDEGIRDLKELPLGQQSEGEDDSAAVERIVGTITIRAPISGRVSALHVVRGELVHSHDAVMEIQDPKRVWIKAFLAEQDAPRIAEDQPASVTFPAKPGLRLEGTVVRVAPSLVSRERVLPVWIEAPNPDEFLKAGMFAQVEIVAPETPARLAASGPPQNGQTPRGQP